METNQEELPLLTFNSLYNILRAEKSSKKLQQLPELFYEALDKFIIDKNNEKEKLKKEPDSADKLRKTIHIIKNSEKIHQELLDLRCVKIANIAIKNKIYGEEVLNGNHILEKEKIFYELVQKGVKKITKNT